MLNGRLYRLAFVPFMLALAIAAFSLTGRPAPLTSTLAPDAFEGAPAFSELQSLAAEFPSRRPGSAGDEALAKRIAHTIEGLGGAAAGGFSVRVRHFEGSTIDGEKPLSTVIAQRPGSTSAPPIVILAHRDAAARGSQAALSGTAALLELARVFAARETRRAIVLVSTSGGSGGDAGAADFLANAHGPFDAAIVLGDLAGLGAKRPFVVPYSDAFGSAPEQLQRTVADAITQETGWDPGAPSVLGQFAHFAFPLAAGEQGPLNAGGLPAVLVQVSGEGGPSPRAPVSAERLAGFGRAVLSTVDALDVAGEVPSEMQTGVLIQQKILPAWALRLLAGALLLGPLILAADGLARLRRRRAPVGRWTLWTLSCALPFLACALFAYVMGSLGVLAAPPSVAVLGGALPFDGSAAAAVVALALVFLLSWMLWRVIMRRLGWGTRPDPEAAGLSMLLLLLGVSLIAWAWNPYTVLLLLPALHLWLPVVSPELRPRALAVLALVALALVPLVLLIAFYADQLGLGPGGVAWTAVLLLAAGHFGVLGAILWSLSFGCAATAAMLALSPASELPGSQHRAPPKITIRGPLSYAGPGSLGGTESALRR
ncbi:MAG: M28 family peptidase [Solirubrobacteraceae bacterium]|jgi:hypothetical protein